jgi:hypothetical protein
VCGAKLRDVGGTDVIHGHDGNDIISDSHSLVPLEFPNIILGGDGKDFIVTWDDVSTISWGHGDDFIYGSKPNLPGDDVVSGASEEVVVPKTAVDAVVAAVAIDGVVVGRPGDHDVIALGAAEHDRFLAGVMQVVGVWPRRAGVVPDHER